MPMLTPAFCPARARLRACALGLAVMLALFQVAAAGHRHDRPLDTHVCAICAAVMDELPSTGTLPPIPAAVATQCYVLSRVIAFVCRYYRRLLTPHICGPPLSAWATRVAILRFHPHTR